jgi:branched-chain amino acid transport system permease protein
MKRRSDLLGVVVLLAALLLLPLVLPTWVVGTAVYATIYAIAAIGLSLLMGLAGQVSLGHAAFFAVGAYTQAILVTRTAVPGLLAAVIAVALAMLAALLVGLPLLRLRGHYLALATLGLGIILTVVAVETDALGATSGIFGIPKPEFGGRRYDTPAEYLWLLAPAVVLAVVVARNLVESRVGRALGAVNDSEVAAETLGVDAFRLRLQVFVLSAGFAGLAGVFFAHWLAVVNPNAAGFSLSVEFLLMAVLGGLGTVWGAVVGGFAVEFLDEGLREAVPLVVPGATGEVQLLGFGIVLTVVMIFLPGGLHQLVRAGAGPPRPRPAPPRRSRTARCWPGRAARSPGRPCCRCAG